jgi:hypothetical protein
MFGPATRWNHVKIAEGGEGDAVVVVELVIDRL